MLTELSITGLGVIDAAVIEPAAGLTVVTGETGAGKTMIVTALGLVCGGRADSGRVRTGAARAVVEARFSAGEPSRYDASRERALAAAAQQIGGDLDEDGSLLTVRSVSADGRSRAHIGGRSAPVAALAELTADLVAIHGQAEAMTLLKPASQRAILDTFASIDLADYRRVRAELHALRAELEERGLRARDLAQREQLLRIGVGEIERLDPQPGEDAKIAAEIRRHSDADALRSAALTAMMSLIGAAEPAAIDEPSAASLINHAVRQLTSASDPALHARLGDLAAALAVITDIGGELAAYVDDLDVDPEKLAAVMERQSQLKALMRKYGEDVDAVLAWAEAAAAELSGLDTSDEAITELRRRIAEREEQLTELAERITAARTAAAARLSTAASGELDHLAMGAATVRVAVTPTGEFGPDGADQVEILLAARPGMPELPIARAASGGELSRIMLALEVVLAGADPVGTLVFDEVDAGVGGRAATEIGRRLAVLARSRQVIVVTHLAQVAAFADRHYVVDADATGSVGASAVRVVDGDSRLAELARMLGGTDGATALAHAADLRDAAKAEQKVR